MLCWRRNVQPLAKKPAAMLGGVGKGALDTTNYGASYDDDFDDFMWKNVCCKKSTFYTG